MTLCCPLCTCTGADLFHSDPNRSYFRCAVCQLVFVHPDHFLSPTEERKRYDLHQNDLHDPRYRAFLSRLFTPMNQRIAPGSHGLDFGSGPGPLLKLMFEEQGHSMALYDPFYAPDRKVLNDQYDFITASEVVEHLHQPRKVLFQLWSSLKSSGSFGIMTSLHTADIDFAAWHYIRDDTHVVFFAPETMAWLSEKWHATIEMVEPNVVIFKKGLKRGYRDDLEVGTV